MDQHGAAAAAIKFPDKKYKNISAYCDDYFACHEKAVAALDHEALARAAEALGHVYGTGHVLYVCGNGGSAATANHTVCDHLKLVQTDTKLVPRVVSLSAHAELVSAIANDIDYADAFLYQLRTLARPGDALMTISASGDSENVVRAIAWAKENGVTTIALTGFAGGRSRAMADIAIHAAAENYAVVEDIHLSVMQMLAQYLRQSQMSEDLIRARKF